MALKTSSAGSLPETQRSHIPCYSHRRLACVYSTNKEAATLVGRETAQPAYVRSRKSGMEENKTRASTTVVAIAAPLAITRRTTNQHHFIHAHFIHAWHVSYRMYDKNSSRVGSVMSGTFVSVHGISRSLLFAADNHRQYKEIKRSRDQEISERPHGAAARRPRPTSLSEAAGRKTYQLQQVVVASRKWRGVDGRPDAKTRNR